MNIPLDFDYVVEYLHNQKYRFLSEPCWSSPQRRHVVADLEREGELFVLKAAVPAERDLYEPNRLYGLQRTVWFSQAMARFPHLPLKVPKVREAVIDDSLVHKPSAWAWVLSEKAIGLPLLSGAPEFNTHSMSAEQEKEFHRLLPDIMMGINQLSRIKASHLKTMAVPASPPYPHGITGYSDEGTLGSGAFELKNLIAVPASTATGNGEKGPRLWLIDTEFASDQYPRYHQLAYFLHRLACVQERADLAQAALDTYYRVALWRNSEIAAEVMKEIRRLLIPKSIGGILNDIRYRRLYLPRKHWHALKFACALLFKRGLVISPA